MATVHSNLSDYDASRVPNASDMRIAIVAAEWNAQITDNLLQGAYDTLIANGANPDHILVERVPGSYELPIGAQMVLEAKPELEAVICVGSVIQGETRHFDFVCEGTALGIKDVSLKYNKPVIFGVLTDNELQQGLDRSGGKHGNKGDEAAVTAIKMIDLGRRLNA